MFSSGVGARGSPFAHWSNFTSSGYLRDVVVIRSHHRGSNA